MTTLKLLRNPLIFKHVLPEFTLGEGDNVIQHNIAESISNQNPTM